MGSYDGLKLTVKNSSFGDRPCRTVTDFETGRLMCNYIAQSPLSATSSNSDNANNNSNSNNNLTFPDDVSPRPVLSSGYYTPLSSAFPSTLPPKSELNFRESIWPGKNNISLHRHCICSNSSGSSGFTFTFLGRKAELTFTIEGMTARDSYENYFVHLDYEVLKGDGCRGDNHYMKTESGMISFESSFSHGPKPPSCESYPWLLEAKENHSLYLRIPGFPMLEEKRANYPYSTASQFTSANEQRSSNSFNESTASVADSYAYPSNATATSSSTAAILPGLAKFQIDRICPTTKNRILIYDGSNKLIQKICPASISNLSKKPQAQIVEIFSEDFNQFHSPLFPPPRSRFVIDFVGKELGSYQVRWLELISAKMKTTLMAMEYDPSKMMSNNISVFPGKLSSYTFSPEG
jgi:hypothetical protein